MSHYFTNDPNLNKDLLSFKVNLRGNEFYFNTQAGVFSKNYLDYGSKLLIRTIKLNTQIKRIVDVGCGYGPIGLALAKSSNAHIYMYDINLRAIDLAKLNAKNNDITNVTIKYNNLLDGIDFKVDLIVTNPPIRAGKQTVFKLYEQAYDKLTVGGEFYCVIQRKQGAPSTVKKINDIFDNYKIIVKSKGYWVIYAKKV